LHPSLHCNPHITSRFSFATRRDACFAIFPFTTVNFFQQTFFIKVTGGCPDDITRNSLRLAHRATIYAVLNLCCHRSFGNEKCAFHFAHSLGNKRKTTKIRLSFRNFLGVFHQWFHYIGRACTLQLYVIHSPVYQLRLPPMAAITNVDEVVLWDTARSRIAFSAVIHFIIPAQNSQASSELWITAHLSLYDITANFYGIDKSNFS